MSKPFKGATIILSLYLLGDVASRLIGGFMPGSILGMLALLAMLQMGVVKEEDIRSVATFVLNNMMLFFIPVTVGLMTSIDLVSSSWMGVVAAILISTILVMAIVGIVQQIIGRKWRR